MVRIVKDLKELDQFTGPQWTTVKLNDGEEFHGSVIELTSGKFGPQFCIKDMADMKRCFVPATPFRQAFIDELQEQKLIEKNLEGIPKWVSLRWICHPEIEIVIRKKGNKYQLMAYDINAKHYIVPG